MNKPLTAEEATNLTFPCLLEVWDFERCDMLTIVLGIEGDLFLTSNNVKWKNAALPSPEIAEAMRKQFGSPSEYPKRMLVWDNDESEAEPRIVIADLGEKAVGRGRYIVVYKARELDFENGEMFDWTYYNHAKPIPEPDPIPEPEPDPISQEIAGLRQMLADLEAKYNQQS